MKCLRCNLEIEPNSEKRWCLTCRKVARQTRDTWNKAHPRRLYSGRDYESRQFILRELGFGSYREYLKSPLWRRLRQRVFAEKGRTCFLCPKEATAIHHNRYHKNDLLGKHLLFVFPVCDECHEGLEFSKKGRKLKLHDAKDRFKHRLQSSRLYR